MFADYDEDNEFVSLMPPVDTKHPEYPYRAIYCRQVRRWVATFDHYCGVIETPVGEKNHARFWFFLQMQTICICWAIGIVHSGFRYPYLSSQKLVGSEWACFHHRNPTLHSSFVCRWLVRISLVVGVHVHDNI